MSNDIKTYQWATAILVILVIILSVSLFQTRKSVQVSESLETVTESLADCNAKIYAWRQANPDGQPKSDEADKELADILSDCGEFAQ